MRNRYYSGLDYEHCYDLSWWKDEAYDRQENVVIEEQKNDTGSGEMWCSIESELITSGDGSCGKRECTDYVPRNGKYGCCRWLKNTLIGTGRFFTVYPDGKVEVIEGEVKD